LLIPENADRGSPTDAPYVPFSPWTLKQRIGRMLWYLVQGTIFRWSPRTAWGWRSMLLRLFGAQIGPRCRIFNTTRIEVPWNLEMRENTCTGDGTILYCLGKVTIGHDVSISQHAHICAGTHELDTRRMWLLRPPIVIEEYAWLATDTFVGPGVRVGRGAILGARASAFKDLKPWWIYGGNPAKPIRQRDSADWSEVIKKGDPQDLHDPKMWEGKA
jgi:putative colanic acid biosynthesis acetyltransferase WcaF